MFSSRFMLFPTSKKKNWCQKCFSGGGGGVEKILKSAPSLNGRWFLQIVDGDSGNLYIQYNPLFPCSDF